MMEVEVEEVGEEAAVVVEAVEEVLVEQALVSPHLHL